MKLQNVQALRFFAALLVVLFHVIGAYESRFDDGSRTLIHYLGYAGVDLFFVISGFVIWKSTDHLTSNDAASFAYRRGARIYTAYIPMALFAFLFYWLNGAPRVENMDMLKSLTLFPSPPKERILTVSWSLTYELYFYMAVALGVLLNARAAAVAALGAVSIIGTVIWAKMGVNPVTKVAFSPMVLEFVAGCVLAKLTDLREPKHGWFWLSAGVAGFLVTGLALMEAGGAPGGMWSHALRTATYGTASLAILWGALALEGKVRVPRILVTLGDASYAIYLLHVLMIVLVWRSFRLLGLPFFSQQPEIGVVAMVVLSLVFGVAYFRYVEDPLRKWAYALPKRRQRTVAAR